MRFWFDFNFEWHLNRAVLSDRNAVSAVLEQQAGRCTLSVFRLFFFFLCEIMAENLVKIVNVIELNANNNNNNNNNGAAADNGVVEVKEEDEADAEPSMAAMLAETMAANPPTRGSRPTTVRISTGHLPSYRFHETDEILAHRPTFSERCIRYVMVLIYLCGLCSLGFVLSIYHIFFWDSRMPPLHKSMIMKKPPGYG